MTRLRSILVPAVLLLSAMITPAYATRFIIQVGNYYFLPATIPNVKPGDTIRWEWVNGAHTTTSLGIPSGAEPWDVNITSLNTVYEYIPTIPGVYNYKCTPHESLGMVASFTVESVGILEHNKKTVQIGVSPNPTNGVVTVSASGVTPGKVTISIVDMSGQIVQTVESQVTLGKLKATLNLSEYPKGIYYIRLTGDKVTGSEQVVLQ